MLFSLHGVASAALKTPELALDQLEAKSLAKAVVDLEAAFPQNIDPRAFAVVNFVGVAAMIYLPKLAEVRRRTRAERAEKTPPNAEALPVPESFAAPFSPEGRFQ